MNKKITALTAMFVLALAGCMQAGVDLDAETAALRAAADAYHEAGIAADTDTVAGMYTNDAITLPPNAEAVMGREGMREFAVAFTETPGFSMSFGETVAHVGAGGDMGYTLVDTLMTFDGPDGEPVTDSTRDFHLWTKDGGEWKVAVDIWNSELPLPGAQATPLQGAWIATSQVDTEGNTNDEPQPAMYVFTPTHYSIMFATGSEPRTQYEGEEMTDAETLVAYETVVANAGRYEIDGNILKTRAYVAKDPNYMGGWPDNEITYEFEMDGDTLKLTSLVFAPGSVTMLRQVEGTPNPW